jgi:hypothetical protein
MHALSGIRTFERPKTVHALDRAVTVIGYKYNCIVQYKKYLSQHVFKKTVMIEPGQGIAIRGIFCARSWGTAFFILLLY